MEIAKYFEKIFKKCDLSNKSSNEEASKKLREGSLDSSVRPTEVLKSPECVSILMMQNCMQNLEKQVGQIFKMLEKTENRQIEGECLLTDLAKGVAFITQIFDKHEKDRLKKDAIIATLQCEIKSVNMKLKILRKRPGKARAVLEEKLYFNSLIKRRKERKYR